jgi:FeS assembly SUF system protein
MDQNDAPKSATRLPVLPNSGKVDQLRSEPQSQTVEKKLADRTPIDDALDSSLPLEQRLIRSRVIAVLKSIYDPEIPVNIFDLGLIYAIDVSPENEVRVRMTLTAPGCPVAGTLPGEIQRKIESAEGVKSSTVELVWDPPWDRSRMSEAALLELGML